MKYTVRVLCLDDHRNDIEHNTNDYKQAQFFFKDSCITILREIECDIHTWEITFWINGEKPEAKYHFSKT